MINKESMGIDRRDNTSARNPDKNPWVALFVEGAVKDLEEPYEGFSEIVKFLENWTQKNALILDVACGNGRHTSELLKQGYSVLAFDVDQAIVEIAKNNIQVSQPHDSTKAHFLVADMYKPFPIKTESIDGVVATQAIYHGRRVDMQFALDEIARVLRVGGPLCFTVSTRPARAGNSSDQKNQLIGENEYLPLEGREKGLIHFYPTIRDLREMLITGFSDVTITNDIENGYFSIACIKK